MTKDYIFILRVICRNCDKTRNSDSLYEIVKYKKKKITKSEWHDIINDLSNMSLVLVSPKYNSISPKPLAFETLEQYDAYQSQTSLKNKLFSLLKGKL